MLAAMIVCAWPMRAAQANVLQLSSAKGTVNSQTISSTDFVFEATSGDIARNILASVGSSGINSPGYFATSSAGVFGQIGLDAGVTSSIGSPSAYSEVLIGSDEFVNVSGFSGTVSSTFIIDGGEIRDLFSTNTTVNFLIQVGAQVVGNSPPVTDLTTMEVESRQTASFGGAAGFFTGFEGGEYLAEFSTDSNGDGTLSTSFTGGLDLGATYDANSRTVEIPLSLQQLDLGVLGPGDRLLISYFASLDILVGGITEGTFASFSDPFSLSSNSILTSIAFTPNGTSGGSVPTPGILSMMIPALLGLRWFRRQSGRVESY